MVNFLRYPFSFLFMKELVVFPTILSKASRKYNGDKTCCFWCNGWGSYPNYGYRNNTYCGKML